jgi:hypothetical protein
MNVRHFRLLAAIPLWAVLAACPGDKKETADTPVAADTTPADTTPVDLSSIKTDIPPADPDTHKAPVLPREPRTRTEAPIPAAPQALMEVVQREQSQSVTRFCFTERGLKSDPQLRGSVVILVTVNASGVSDARVGASNWTSRAAGQQVNACLNEKTKQAWRLEPGAVRPGRYQVPLQFAGS